MCGTEGKISPRKKLEACREEEDKKEDNGLAEREDENNCNARDAKWNHLPTQLQCQRC